MRLSRLLERSVAALASGEAAESSQFTVFVRSDSHYLDSPDAWLEFPVTRTELDDDERSIELEYAHLETEPALTVGELVSVLRAALDGREDFDVFASEFRRLTDDGMLMSVGVVGFKWEDGRFGVIRWYDAAERELT